VSRQQWQSKLGEPGVRVDGLAELEQSLSIVLTTPVGSVPGRPSFGSRLHELIDQPVSTVRARAPQEVRRAVTQNEPRIEIIDTAIVDPTPDGGVTYQVYWRPAQQPDAAAKMTEVTVQ
jgi:phage baseplate assembly protein W